MDANDASKISELARSLYEHRLVSSMDEAVEKAKAMISTDSVGGKVAVEATRGEVLTSKEIRAVDYSKDHDMDVSFDSYNILNDEPEESNELDSTNDESTSDEPVQRDFEEQEDATLEQQEDSVNAGDTQSSDFELPETVQDAEEEEVELAPLPDIEALESEVEALKLSEEGAEEAISELNEEINEVKEQLEESTKEFEEIRGYLKEIEELARDSKVAVKKEKDSIKIADIADDPVTEE